MTTTEANPNKSQIANEKTSSGLGCLVLIILVLGGINLRDRLVRIEQQQQEILNRLSINPPAEAKDAQAAAGVP